VIAHASTPLYVLPVRFVLFVFGVSLAVACKSSSNPQGAPASTVSIAVTTTEPSTAKTPLEASGSSSAQPSPANSAQAGGDTAAWLAAIAGYDAGTAPQTADRNAPAFRKVKMDDAELSRIISNVPELSKLGKELRFFTQGDAVSVTQRNKEDANGFVFSEKPLQWSPEVGADVLVLTGRSKNTSFVIALYPLGGGSDSYRLASFFVAPGDTAPLILAYKPERRRELFWTGCWNCQAEQGGVSYRDDKRVVIVQH
jgi:hypothetical protein